MAQLHSAAEALNWNTADSTIERFNKPTDMMMPMTYGFKGFPENYMMKPKQPLRHQQSADITADVNRYFRRETPKGYQPQERMPSPPPPPPQQQQKEPDWLQQKGSSPHPAMQPADIKQTISPRYPDEESSFRRPPVIRDPHGTLTSAERRKKIEEHYVAEEDLAMARQRRDKERMEKREEQQKIREMQAEFNPYGLPGGGAPFGDNRKMKFTEHQLRKPGEPEYVERQGARYEDERGMDRRNFMPERREAFGRAATMPMVRSAYSDSYRPRPDQLRNQEMEMDELRRNINQLERERQFERTNREPRYEPSNDRMDMLQDQAKQIKYIGEEIDRIREAPHLLRPAGMPSRSLHEREMKLRAQDDMSNRNGYRRSYDAANPRAQSEPQTDRPSYMRVNRDNEVFGESRPDLPEYLNMSPRRKPVGKLYNKDSTYMTDFDVPFAKHGSRNLGNPNKEAMELFDPFGHEGGGAPKIDDSGRKRTRYTGAIGILGRELSHSARARRAPKSELLHEIGEQAAFDRARREQEKAENRQGAMEVADTMRHFNVGYPRFKQTGLISERHHLPQMFNTNPIVGKTEQRKYHDFLERQIEERNQNIRLGQYEERRQAKEHFRTQDSFFGPDRWGGGNVKGMNKKKVNLDRAIHNPQTTSQYYNKVRLEDEISPHDILNKFKPRITINSTHKNLYEYPQGDLKRQLLY